MLLEGDGQAFRKWLEPYAKERGAEVLISDDNDSYGVASAGMGLSHQLCVAHVGKYLKRRSESILEQAEEEWGNQDGKYKTLEEDLKRLRELLEELPEEGGKRIGRLHREYLWAQSPRKGQAKKARAGYRMRMLNLGAVEQVAKNTTILDTPRVGIWMAPITPASAP